MVARRTVVRPKSPQRQPGPQFVGPAFAPHGPEGLDPVVLVPELGSSGGRAHYSRRPPTLVPHQLPLALASCHGSPVHIQAPLVAPGAAREGRWTRPPVLLSRRRSKARATPLEQNPPNKLLPRWLHENCSAAVVVVVVVLLVLRFGPHTLCLPGWPLAG